MSVVELTLRGGPELTVDEIHEVIVEIIGGIRPDGCEHCGLLGVDLVIRGGDPEFYRQIAKVSANKDVVAVTQADRGAISSH